MYYLSGAPSLDHMRAGHFGFMLNPNMGNDRQIRDNPTITWAADNGCFSGRWDPDRWWAWLQSMVPHTDRCLFAVAPDVVGNAEATLTTSAPWLPKIRALGYKAAFVAQDGLEQLDVPWDTFDVLFIGGSTTWKLSAHAQVLVRQAKDLGKWVHMGRVNSHLRLRLAAWWGCDSADGTYLKYGHDVNLPKLRSMIRASNHPTLFPPL